MSSIVIKTMNNPMLKPYRYPEYSRGSISLLINKRYPNINFANSRWFLLIGNPSHVFINPLEICLDTLLEKT
ncbi:MAG TPA: hypothetical protein ENG40_02070 [Thermoprotei archaeon]|nr:hypothetical protein [Thermoprotei archaeon]